jgi:hypothetical protein
VVLSRIPGEPVCDGIVGHLVASMNVEMCTTSSTFDPMFVMCYHCCPEQRQVDFCLEICFIKECHSYQMKVNPEC